jgi:L-ascorbate metabolism protein UlaG (beta-lactamase superfamily)
MPVRIQKFAHSCLLVEEGGTRLLLDPGSFSSGFEGLTGLTGVLVTHIHGDHLDVDRLHTLLEANPDARVVSDEASAEPLAERGVTSQVVHEGDSFDLGVPIRAYGRRHAVVHPDLTVVPNVGYLVANRLFHPGDAFTVPDEPVEVLGVPAGAPWMRLADAIDYLRAVRPRRAVPIHECVLAFPRMAYGVLDQLSPQETTLTVLDDAGRVEV